MAPEHDRLVPVCERGTRFEAEVVAASLHAAGIQASVEQDPAMQAAPHFATDRVARVLVPAAELDQAQDLVEPEEPAAYRSVWRGPLWMRVFAVLLVAFLLMMVALLVWAIASTAT